ncbi:hypothetical protein RGR602_PC02263 (plasmid) [Rhizobium gallicum bv. gallicum R602sp]|uniref:Uncharacterized protein n=1 Tax=Rhizobium gallicum bv. gallicum R602sp TaxID=1041138 RepID=A0A0B4XIQ1_9HYPH|nr:hypothetical protein RGR602_PC02263 [Rhizobium gallicum bv. gallicum R602sp]
MKDAPSRTDETLYPSVREQLAKTLGPVRDMLCHELSVDVPACQFAMLPVYAVLDPRVNVELSIMPRAERTRDLLMSVCAKVEEALAQSACDDTKAQNIAA